MGGGEGWVRWWVVVGVGGVGRGYVFLGQSPDNNMIQFKFV